MTRKRTAHIVEVRPTKPDDGEFFAPSTWIATDSEGRRYGSDSEEAARKLAEDYLKRSHTK